MIHGDDQATALEVVLDVGTLGDRHAEAISGGLVRQRRIGQGGPAQAGDAAQADRIEPQVPRFRPHHRMQEIRL
jgi:hypothetical protein